MKEREEFDVIIIGAGPSGLSSAIWCADLGLRALVVEEHAEVGGQLLWTFNDIRNYPGIISTTGHELRNLLLEQVKKTGVAIRGSIGVQQADLAQGLICLSDGSSISSRFVILATGVRRRTLKIPGEAEFLGRGVLTSGVRDRVEMADRTVVIVGGGDAAVENASILGAVAKHVTVIHRGSSFSASKDIEESARRMPNVTMMFSTKLMSIVGETAVSSVELMDLISGKQQSLETDAVLIRIGVTPNTELFQEQLAVDLNGYIKVGVDCATNIETVFAVGDVTNCNSPTISTATGMGATAAKAISAKLRNWS